MGIIDLRSDTVTLPTPEMRRAMAEAEVGDDVYGEDPTVNRLEEMAAEVMGKEAALLVPSGTMANLVSILVHCPRGTRAVMGAKAHSNLYEAGGASAVGSVMISPVRNTDEGELDLDELTQQIDTPLNPHFARPALVVIENTHNLCGGAAVSLSHLAEANRLVHGHGLPLHLDGARIFNAAVALETTAAQIARFADTASFCLSKGLACPVGSLICGPRAFVDEARRVRKVLGGGMRQAGVIAAAGIVALQSMIGRLAEDHENARLLARGLESIQGLVVERRQRPTNMVFFSVPAGPQHAARFHAELKTRGVLVIPRDATRLRAVTHFGITAKDVQDAVHAAEQAARQSLRAN
jgi:threonine aldolase